MHTERIVITQTVTNSIPLRLQRKSSQVKVDDTGYGALYGQIPSQKCSCTAHIVKKSKDHIVLHSNHAFISKLNEPQLPLPS